MEELLKKLGYSEEQITAILQGMEEQKLTVLTAEEHEKLINHPDESEEHKKLQEDYNTASAAKDALEAEKQTWESEKQALESEKLKLQNDLKVLQIETQVKAELSKRHVKDVDYALYQINKAGDLALDEDGKVVDLVAKIDAIQKNTPDNFASEDRVVIPKKPEKHDMDQEVMETPQNLKEAIQMEYSSRE
ncbi:MAG: hypothetical protein IJ079_03870 [Lachnospiraceae bacterium]|nr:hypothetical protein [Lachnospiraceae bacterium]MBR1567546.1 hypothetical protein [Lachnospiraceae bacterium]MBR1568702.1 hypothetical protein [Lachnospiraceae bacterium]